MAGAFSVPTLSVCALHTHFFRSVGTVGLADIVAQNLNVALGPMIALFDTYSMSKLQKSNRVLSSAVFVVCFGAFISSPSAASAVDVSTILLATPGAVQAVAEDEADTLDVEHAPKRQPYELKRIYRRYRTVFRTVAKGVDLSQELFGLDTRGDTLRVRFRPTSANPERMGGVVSCNVRF